MTITEKTASTTPETVVLPLNKKDAYTSKLFYKGFKFRAGQVQSGYDESPWTDEWRELNDYQSPIRCSRGFHASASVSEALSYCDHGMLALVEVSGEIDGYPDEREFENLTFDDKIASHGMHIIKLWYYGNLTGEEVANGFKEYVYSKVVKTEEVTEWVEEKAEDIFSIRNAFYYLDNVLSYMNDTDETEWNYVPGQSEMSDNELFIQKYIVIDGVEHVLGKIDIGPRLVSHVSELEASFLTLAGKLANLHSELYAVRNLLAQNTSSIQEAMKVQFIASPVSVRS